MRTKPLPVSQPDESLRRLLAVEGAATGLLRQADDEAAGLLTEAQAAAQAVQARATAELGAALAVLEARMVQEREAALAAIGRETAERLAALDRIALAPLADRLIGRLLETSSEPGSRP
jgi:hypothetical protein